MLQNPHPWGLTLTQMPHPWGQNMSFLRIFEPKNRTQALSRINISVFKIDSVAISFQLFSLKQIPHPGANLQKANAQPWEQVQLKMPNKRRGGGRWAPMELIET